MSYQKQPHLNGAYYGPAIPPPQYSHRPGRSGGRGCCSRFLGCIFGCLCDCGCCLFGCVFKIIFGILIAIALLALLVYIIILPQTPKFSATDASLASFDLSGTQLSYDFNFANLTIRNPNRRLGIYYDSFEVNVFYEGQRFDTKEVPSFFQDTKNTSFVGPVSFKGRTVVVLGSDESSNYENQKAADKFNVVVRLHLKIRFKLGFIKTGKWNPKVKCELSLPLTNSSSSASTFQEKGCDYYY